MADVEAQRRHRPEHENLEEPMHIAREEQKFKMYSDK